MNSVRPIIDGYCVDCPAYNGEWMLCKVTGSPCPKQDDGEPDGYPDDCPAKTGFIVKV